MTGIDSLTYPQRTALQSAAQAPLLFKGHSDGYQSADGAARFPARTVRALWRAGLIELENGRAAITVSGRAIVQGGLS